MKNIHLYELKEYLIQKLHTIYIFLGDDYSLLQRNQDVILHFAYQKGFLNTIKIEIEKDQDWEKVIVFYKTKNLFFEKTILIINCVNKNINIIFMKKIYKIFSLLEPDILTILKLNHLSHFINNKQFSNLFKKNNNIISCFTPYDTDFIDWIKYEIKERNIQIEEKAFVLLCKYYSGNTLFIYNILDILAITWPNIYINNQKIKKIILNLLDYSSLNWIDYIFQLKTKKALSILYFFSEKKYNPLILVRALQKDLVKLIYIKRDKNINTHAFLKKYNICAVRHEYFINAFKKIHYNNLFQAIQILVKIEINIKKSYNYSVWQQLQELTIILNN